MAEQPLRVCVSVGARIRRPRYSRLGESFTKLRRRWGRRLRLFHRLHFSVLELACLDGRIKNRNTSQYICIYARYTARCFPLNVNRTSVESQTYNMHVVRLIIQRRRSYENIIRLVIELKLSVGIVNFVK